MSSTTLDASGFRFSKTNESVVTYADSLSEAPFHECTQDPVVLYRRHYRKRQVTSFDIRMMKLDLRDRRRQRLKKHIVDFAKKIAECLIEGNLEQINQFGCKSLVDSQAEVVAKDYEGLASVNVTEETSVQQLLGDLKIV